MSWTGSLMVSKVSTCCHRRMFSEYSYIFTLPWVAAPPAAPVSSLATAIMVEWSRETLGFQEMQEQGNLTGISSRSDHCDMFITSSHS